MNISNEYSESNEWMPYTDLLIISVWFRWWNWVIFSNIIIIISFTNILPKREGTPKRELWFDIHNNPNFVIHVQNLPLPSVLKQNLLQIFFVEVFSFYNQLHLIVYLHFLLIMYLNFLLIVLKFPLDTVLKFP